MEDGADWGYYEVLEIERDATQAEIKKAYFRTAKKYHPDKNRGNVEAEDMFKRVNEAHECLSNPEKRALYDAHGKAGLETAQIDLREIVKTVFGGGMFETIFGDVCTLPMIEQLFQQVEGDGRLAAGAFENDKNWNAEQRAALRLAEEKNCEQLAAYLAKKIKQSHQDSKMFAELIRTEALGLVETPGGAELLGIVGYIYTQEAQQFIGGPLGWAAEVAERGHYMAEGAGILGQVVGVLSMSKKLENEGNPLAAAQQNNTKSQDLQQVELQKQVMSKGLDTVWRVGKLLLEERIRKVVELVLAPLQASSPGMVDSIKELFFTGQVTDTDLKRQAMVLLQMGTIWTEISAAALKSEAEEDNTGFASLKRQVNMAAQAAAGEGP